MLACKVQRAIADLDRCGAIACLVLAHGRDAACVYERYAARRACPSFVGAALVRVTLCPPAARSIEFGHYRRLRQCACLRTPLLAMPEAS